MIIKLLLYSFNTSLTSTVPLIDLPSEIIKLTINTLSLPLYLCLNILNLLFIIMSYRLTYAAEFALEAGSIQGINYLTTRVLCAFKV